MKQIELTQGKLALVDDEDYEWINQWKWCVTNNGYAQRHDRGTIALMHRVILGATVSGHKVQVDHINHNKLANRRSNLRFCTPSQNKANIIKQKNNSGQYKGVSWDRQLKKWRVKITQNQKQMFIGLYDDPVIAAQVYNEKAIGLFGEFACLNKIQERI
jgi:hypothetical protein